MAAVKASLLDLLLHVHAKCTIRAQQSTRSMGRSLLGVLKHDISKLARYQEH